MVPVGVLEALVDSGRRTPCELAALRARVDRLATALDDPAVLLGIATMMLALGC